MQSTVLQTVVPRRILLLTVMILIVFSSEACALKKPKFLGVYVESDDKLSFMGWSTKPSQAIPVNGNEFTIITYGINLNTGAGDILSPKETVGVQKEGSRDYFYLHIEALDDSDNYYRYHLPENLPDNEPEAGTYFFFIKSRAWDHRDKYYFKINKKK